MDLQFFADETGNLILASGALGTAAFGFVDVWKAWITGRGRGYFFSRADPEGWALYSLILGARDWNQMPLSKLVAAKLKEDSEDFVEEYVQALTDELDLALIQEPGQPRLDAVNTLAKALGWGRTYGADSDILNLLPKADGTQTEEPGEAKLARAMARRAAALRNLDRRARFAAVAAKSAHGRANRSAAMITAMVMSVLAWGAYAADEGGTSIWNWSQMVAEFGVKLPFFLFVGAVAVPMAPVAKQLSTALTDLAASASGLSARLTGRRED
ncbi:MAG: hypothetical protein ACI9VR_000538 [Cognaticolwellia sp.]|jgi:hypothetical protein